MDKYIWTSCLIRKLKRQILWHRIFRDSARTIFSWVTKRVTNIFDKLIRCRNKMKLHFLHPRAELTCIARTSLPRSHCIFARGMCAKSCKPGQRERTRHDRKMQSAQADKKKFALLDRFVCTCHVQMSAYALTSHGSSKSMTGTHDWNCYLMTVPLMQINFARGVWQFWKLITMLRISYQYWHSMRSGPRPGPATYDGSFDNWSQCSEPVIKTDIVCGAGLARAPPGRGDILWQLW